MRFFFLLLLSAAFMAMAAVPARPQGLNARPSGQAASPGQTVLDKAAAANKYALLLFWREQNPQTDKAWRSLQEAGAKMADRADIAAIRATDPVEKALADRFDLTRAPMPLLLAIAPSGAVTKAFQASFDEKQLQTAFVSPCTARCLKSLQDRKLVLLCILDKGQPKMAIPPGVLEFRADSQYGQATEIIVLDVNDPAESALLRELPIGAQSPKPATVFLAPPGAMIGTFDASVTKQQLAAKLAAAQSNPCAGGKCGPGGCGPKK